MLFAIIIRMNKIALIFKKYFGENDCEREFKIRFSDRALWTLILPLIIEQFLGTLMGIADSIMVSSQGDAAVSGVSLVDMIFVLFFNMFTALATGGAVVASRAIGEGKPDKARRSASCLLIICAAASITLMVLVYIFDTGLLRLLFGSIEDDVMSAAETYMRTTLISFPMVALYSAAAALFRSEGNSKISMITQTAVNIFNIAGNALFIFVFKWGVFGAALATLLGRAFSCIYLLIKLADRKNTIYVDYRKLVGEKGSGSLYKSILSVGLPGSLESGTFQLGRILVLSIISTFGTVQITANAVANNIDGFGVMVGSAFSYAIVTVIGQCVGAEDYRAVKYYTSKLLRLSILSEGIFNALLFASLPLLLSLYSITAEARELAVILICIHNITAVALWTHSFVLPGAMKATGDAKYVMIVAVLSMFIFRVGLSYILGIKFGMGAIGVWISMIVDWIVRIICFCSKWRSIMKKAEAGVKLG